MNPERIAALLTEDGEVCGIVRERVPARSYGGQFVTVFPRNLDELVDRIGNRATALRLLLKLPLYLDWTTFRTLDQMKIAEKMGTDQSAISKSLKLLVELGAVERTGKGPVVRWRLSIDWGWKGTVDGYHAARAQRGKIAPPTAANTDTEDRRRDIMETQISATSSTKPSTPTSTPGGRRSVSQP